MFGIQQYHGGRDAEIAKMILNIQNEEAGLALTLADQPDLLNIAAAYEQGGFWIATDADRVIGSIGLLNYHGRGVLKKFFVAKPYRGSAGPAVPLFDALIQEARHLQLVDLVLDTPAIAVRSHAFYARAGFVKIDKNALPPGYEFPDRNSLLFRLDLSCQQGPS